MAANKVVRFGPTAITGSAANFINSTITSLTGPVGWTATAPYIILRHLRIVNTTAGALTVQLFVGATGGSAAGTEFFGSALSVAANSYVDWYGMLRLDAADFLTTKGSTTGMTIEGEGEVGFS